jgi:hypothetical protein
MLKSVERFQFHKALKSFHAPWRRSLAAAGFGKTGATRSIRLAALLGVSLAVQLGAIPAGADPLGAPGMTPPLSPNPDPVNFDGGMLGKVYVSAQLSVLGFTQTHRAASPYPGNSANVADISNAQFEIQTTQGPVQLFVEAGAYALPTLGASYVHSARATKEGLGAVPVAYLKLVPVPDVSIQVGSLPTVIGAESTFTFQNMNIEHGLLSNQSPATSRGVQINYSHGPLLASASLNDGFYSGRYNWVSGLVSYVLNPASTVVIDGGANFGRTRHDSFVTPLAQSNSWILDLMYTYTKGPLTVNPSIQLTGVRADPVGGLATSAGTSSGAVLAKWSFTSQIALAARIEYLKTSAGTCATNAPCAPVNLLFGPHSAAFSATLTPTYQRGRAFIRGELSWTMASHIGAGAGFGLDGNARNQTRGLVETGLLF